MKQLVTGAVAWFASFNFTRDVTVAYTGVPLNVLVACAIGAYCSFSVGERITERRAMWGLFVMCLFLGAAFTAVCNAVVQHTFTDLVMTDALQAGMGCIVAFVSRFFLPWLAEVAKTGSWLKWIPFIGKKE